MISASSGVTARLARYLDRLLRPLLKRAHHSEKWLTGGADFIRRFQSYATEQARLSADTKFVTLKIKHLYTMLPHDGIVAAVSHFLSINLPWNRIENLSFETVQRLTELFLHNNVFFYNGKIYRHEKGCPNRLRLSDTLAKIYLLSWRKPLMDILHSKQEFFAR